MWWQLEVVANLTISVAYFAISYAILAPLVREGQLRTNRLGAATAAIFFSCGIGHGMHGIHPLLYSLGDRSALAVAARVVPAHEAIWDGITALVGVYYWTLRRSYGSLMRGAALFADLEHQQRLTELEAREAVAEARHLSSGVLDAATEQAIIGTDLDGRITVFNVGAQRMLGYSEDQMLGRTPEELYDRSEIAARAAELGVEAGRASITHALEDLAADTRQWTYVTSDGRRITVMVTVTAMHNAAGQIIGYISVGTDVTEQRRAELVLEEERRLLRDAQAIGHTGSWERDLIADTITWSDSLYDLYGFDRDTSPGQYATGLDRIHPDDREPLDRAMKACIETGEPMRIRYRTTRRNDGELRWFDLRGERIDQGGRAVRLAGAVADVTDLVIAAAELAEARDIAVEASRQKSAFLATMSHEIRTPMNAVIGMTGLLLDTPLDDDQREFVETVRTSGDSLLGIINDILDFSKIEAGGLELERQSLDLVSCVDDALELVAATSSAKGLELIGYVDARVPSHVVGDVTRLRQVLVNLLSNAVKFTARGEVVLSVEPDGHSDEGTRLRIAISDTGIGIPADRLARLFHSFSQVDASTTRIYGGTGLGLAISQRLVEAMGGRVRVDSVPGTGSTFSFSIAFEAAGVETPSPSSLDQRTALVVDHNATSRRILRLQLQTWGLTVADAADGEAALRLVDSGAHFDVAVLAMKMPGMDGLELGTRLRSGPASDLALILLSDHEHRPTLEDHKDLFAAVLTKPARCARLLQVLLDALSPPEAMPSAEGRQDRRRSPPRRALRVLLAEDNAVNQRLGRLMLEKLGHHIDSVGNGREATEALRRAPYDVVLMDVEMPEMDGLEATRVIKGEIPASRRPYIVAVTASALVEDRVACRDAGMDDYLAKPVRLQDLEEALHRVPAANR